MTAMNVEVWGGVLDGHIVDVPELVPEVRVLQPPVRKDSKLILPSSVSPELDEAPDDYAEYKLCWRDRKGKHVPVYVPAPIAARLN